MDKVEGFYNTLAKAIERKSKTRIKFEETIATCHLNEWLTDEEVTILLVLLDKYFPVPVPQA